MVLEGASYWLSPGAALTIPPTLHGAPLSPPLLSEAACSWPTAFFSKQRVASGAVPPADLVWSLYGVRLTDSSSRPVSSSSWPRLSSTFMVLGFMVKQLDSKGVEEIHFLGFKYCTAVQTEKASLQGTKGKISIVRTPVKEARASQGISRCHPGSFMSHHLDLKG